MDKKMKDLDLDVWGDEAKVIEKNIYGSELISNVNIKKSESNFDSLLDVYEKTREEKSHEKEKIQIKKPTQTVDEFIANKKKEKKKIKREMKRPTYKPQKYDQENAEYDKYYDD